MEILMGSRNLAAWGPPRGSIYFQFPLHPHPVDVIHVTLHLVVSPPGLD